MNIIKLQVKNFEITPLEKQYVVENQVNEFAIEFEFDDSWNYETKYVIFDNEESTYKRPIINNQVIVPSELLNGRTTIQIYGQNVENGEIVKRKPSYKYSFSILNSLSTDGQEESDLPTPSQWEVYIQQVQDLCNDLQQQFDDLKEDCETKCNDVIERLAKDEQDIQTNTDNIRANAEAIDKLNTDLLDYSLITETGNKISMSINSQTYVITLSLKDKNDNVLSTQSVDLPLETMIVSASYSNGVLTFTLKNGQTLQVPIGDLINGLVSTDKFNQTVQDLSDRISTIENDYLKSSDKTELQEQITANADDIDNIQEEQLTQNADIEELQQENERLQRIVSGLPTKNASGTSFVLNDMVKANIKDYQLRGNTIQDGTPTPDTPIEIQSVKGNQEINVFGKNLFDENKTSDNYYYDNEGNQVSGYGTKYINQTYYINNKSIVISFTSKVGNPYVRVCEFNGDTFIKRTLLNTNGASVVLDNNTNKIIFSSNDLNGNDIFENLQIELGNTPTPYEKFTQQSKTISLGNIELNKIGSYQDRIYKQGNKWYLEKNTNEIELTSSTSTNWYISGIYNCCKTLLATTNISNIASYNFQTTINNVVMSDKFTQALPNDIYLGNSSNCIGVSSTDSPEIYLNVSGLTTKQQYESWLDTNKPKLLYALSTPITTEITDENLISQLEDILNIILNENNTIIVNGNLPSDTLVIGYADIAKLIASLSSQDNRSVEENTRKSGEVEETKEEER